MVFEMAEVSYANCTC